MMNFWKNELEKITKSFEDKKFVGNAMYINLDETRKLKVQFDRNGTKDKYEKVTATLLDKNLGVFDKMEYNFFDEWRTDDKKFASVFDYGDIEPTWRNYKPNEKDYNMIENHIIDFYDLYMEQENEYQMGGM